MKKILLLIVLLSVSFPALPSLAQRLPETVLRVGLLQKAASFNLSCEEDYYLYEMGNGTQYAVKPLNDYLVKARGGSLYIDGKKYASPVRLVAVARESRLRINGKRYRDNILIIVAGGRMTVINELGIEDYLCGILPSEVSADWPAESLKAQAVVSRTYALKNLRRHEDGGFDICTQTHCQVYGGLDTEDERTNRAVDETKGEVLVYQDQLVQALFHASCGGHTEDPGCVWSWDTKTPEYLKGVRDPFCSNSPHQDWKNTVSMSFLKSRLIKAGYELGEIRKIQMSGRDASGRTKTVRVSGSRGATSIAASKFRMAIDPWYIRSAWFTDVRKKGDGFEFTGRGWGHGVGMCQWGAKEMAGHGRDYRDILSTYYPGAHVETWEE